MNHSTKPTLLEKLVNLTKINQRFHRYQEDEINQDNSIFICLFEATLIYQGRIKNNNLISKFNKQINLKQTIGEQSNLFSEGFYMNFYLFPKDKHYWRIPYDSKPISTEINNGKSRIPIITGLERIFPRTDFFEKAIKNNATISTIFQTKDFPYAMIAVGSLNVNSIHTIKKEYFQKGDIGGYFNLGSSMLLCFPRNNLKNSRILISNGDKVSIGDSIIKIN
ncbi:MAG: phosphatidylserine decarboxylase [Candidatus Heimdallarchaeaceae archaeon]